MMWPRARTGPSMATAAYAMDSSTLPMATATSSDDSSTLQIWPQTGGTSIFVLTSFPSTSMSVGEIRTLGGGLGASTIASSGPFNSSITATVSFTPTAHSSSSVSIPASTTSLGHTSSNDASQASASSISPPSTSPSTVAAGELHRVLTARAIVGVSVGATTLAALLAMAIWVLSRRKRRSTVHRVKSDRRSTSEVITPFFDIPATRPRRAREKICFDEARASLTCAHNLEGCGADGTTLLQQGSGRVEERGELTPNSNPGPSGRGGAERGQSRNSEPVNDGAALENIARRVAQILSVSSGTTSDAEEAPPDYRETLA